MRNRKITIRTILLFPFALLYGAVISVRNFLFDQDILPSKEFDLPVISVGNISMGGTGKTPHVEYLIDLLKDEFNVATLSRGYLRRSRGFRVAEMGSSASEIGDEPRQLKQKYPDITVAVDRRRVHGIQKLLAASRDIDVIILDDAFQHRYVKPGKSILLMDYNRLVQDDFLLPAGRLREPRSAITRAHTILITRSPERIKPIELRSIVKRMDLGMHQHLFFTTVEYGDFKPVYDIADQREASWFKNKDVPVLLLTGIANPRPLRKYARRISTRLTELRFPDHHTYTQRDMENITRKYYDLGDPNALILTTMKDAMRLHAVDPGDELKQILYYVTIRVRFLNDDQEEFNKQILNYVRSNQRDNLLHQGKNRS
jgi:tetraacyldisaccharide 4'-kinase